MQNALRLFLVEDDDDVALLMRKSLERAGHRVTCCRSAADALLVLSHSAFDLVLLDHRLPDMAGLDLLKALAEEGIAVPALMVTAYGDEQLATRVLRAGALDYVVKDPALAFLAELPKRILESVTRHRLQETNRLLAEALESARDGIMITDVQGTILHVNRALEQMSGFARKELIGQTPRLLKSGQHDPQFYTEMWKQILGCHSWEGELVNRRRDGSTLPVSLTISPILDAHGQATHFVGIERDVTERKQLERQLLQAQKMQSVGTLAGGVAHEFNNLLAGINGYASLGLREDDVPLAAREFFQFIVDLSERAAHLTRQLLTFARKPALLRRPTAMADSIQATADLVGRTLRIAVEVDIEGAHDEYGELLVEADSNQLQQALVNLALNARDAMEDQTIRERNGDVPPVVFRLRHRVVVADLPSFPGGVPPGEYVVVEVEDRGPGMAQEVLNQALDPFFTTKEVGQGTGLGLPMVFGIVQAHHGHLTIDSEPGRGTRVGIWLPRLVPVRPSSATDLEIDLEAVLPSETMPPRSILVADDENAVLDVVRRFLEIAGHAVHCVSSGAEAVGVLQRQPGIDLLILDVMMPNEDVEATFERVRHWRPGLPVLICTGMAVADPVPRLRALPGVGVLRKPFRMNDLWQAVRQALDG